MGFWGATARALLWLSVAAICFLTFVWPFAISIDPEQPYFKAPAIGALLTFFAATGLLLAQRIAGRR
jgi:hypothetical protein